MPVFCWFEWNTGFPARFLSNPPPGRQPHDLLGTTGIRISFDQTRKRQDCSRGLIE